MKLHLLTPYINRRNMTLVASALLGAVIVFAITNARGTVQRDPCQFEYLSMIVGYDTAGMTTSEEQQRECSLKKLRITQPAEITETIVDDIPYSAIRDMGNGKETDWKTVRYNACIKKSLFDSNPVILGCLIEIDLRLKETIRSLVITINNRWPPSLTAINGDINIEQTKTDWDEWYVSEDYTGNLKAKTCVVEALQSRGGSNAGIWFSECIIKHDALEILWLLERLKDMEVSDAIYEQV